MAIYPAQDGPSPSGYYETNLVNLGKFLMANNYSRAAAAGIAGCIAGESGGNPESVGSGGGGLIGWTPLPPGMVTGNATADLNYQFGKILVYNQIWATYISELNAQTDPVAAADYYSQNFERPAVRDSDVRSAMCTLVYNAIGGTVPPVTPPVTPPLPPPKPKPEPVPQPPVWAYGPPGAVSSEVVGGVVTVRLSWTPPDTTIPVFSDPEPPAALGYIVWVYRVEPVASNLIHQVMVTGTEVIVTLDVGTTYIVHVAADAPAPTVAKDVFATLTFVAGSKLA